MRSKTGQNPKSRTVKSIDTETRGHGDGGFEERDCKHFLFCSANLCPLDPDLDERSWFIGEAICRRKDLAGLSMVKRQKQLNRKRPGEYSGKPLQATWLRRSAPRKRVLSEEHRAQLRDRMNKLRKNTGSEETAPSPPP